MRHLFKIVLAALLVLTVLSCEMFDNSAGSFQIKFQWPEEGTPDFAEKEYHMWVVLEQWKDGDDEKASIVMQTAPTKFSTDGKATVDLSDVKYAENLVIKVEIRGSTKTQDRVLYYGRSELFIFKSSDKNKEVKVKLQTQATPGTGSQDENGISLKIVQNGKEVTKINNTVVSVRVRVINGTKVIIANSLSILEQYLSDNSSVTDGVIEKPVSELTEAGEGLYDLEDWDLNTGLAFSDSDGGERVVYGKLVNDEGYVSETIQATVGVDKTAPVIINPTVSPNPAKLDDVVTVTFSFNEDIDPETLELNWDGLDFGADESAEGNILKYTRVISPEDEEKTYTLTGSAKDVIGNGPVEFQLGELLIDRTKPSIKNETVAVTDDKSSIRTGDTVTVTFEVSEEIEGKPEVTVDGKKFNRVGEATELYEFSYLVSDEDLDGTKTILVSLTDTAGNSDVVELGTKVKFDLSVPEIVNPIVTPSGDPGLAALGSRIEIRFNISEEVDELKFFVNGTENTDTFTESVDGLTYTYSRTVDSSDSAVTAYVFSVSAIDSAGNSLAEQTLGTVKIDVIKPVILTHVISKNKVKLLESFNVELNISEALATISLLVGSKDISSTCTLSTTVDNQYVCTHVANEDDDEGDGVKQFSVMMTDLAGNSSTVQLKDTGGANETIEYDVTPPDIVNPVVAPEKANLDSTIDVRFSFTENVDNLVVDWGDLDGKFIRDNEETNKKLFIYKHKVTDEDEEGVFPVTVTSAFDEAGNEINAAILIGNVEIDNSAPVIYNTDISVNDDTSRSYVVTNDSVKIIFEVHEEISDYAARIGLLKIESCTEETVTEGMKYTCSYSTPSSDDGEGTKDVTVEVKDLAGNAKSYPIGQLTFDMSDPEISSSIVIPEKVNLSSSDVQVKFSFSEDVSVLSEDVTMVADPLSAEVLTLTCNTGTDYKKQFTCTVTFEESDTRVASYAVSVDASDKAGNKVEDVSVGTVSIDREKPNITESNVDPVSVRSGESFEITFAVNETLAAAPIVKVGDKELPGTECSEVSLNNFSCTHIANNDGDETDGTKSITVNLRDPAGNISTEVLTKTVSYDATRPTVINTIIIPESVANKYDSTIQVRFSFSESIDPSSFDFKVDSKEGLLTLPAFSCLVSGTNNQSFICQGTYPGANTDIDELTFSVKASDTAGNTLKEADAYEILGMLEIDRKPPTITFGDILPANVNKLVNEVTVEFTVDGALVENPRVYLGSIMSTTPKSSTPDGDLVSYTYEFADLSELSDGYVSVTVEVADLAGNTATNEYYNALTVDRTSPSVMTSSLSPKVVNKQTEELQISLTFSEPIDSFSGANITSSLSAFSSWDCQDPDAGGQNFICSHDLDGLTLSDINYEFYVVANDLSGNSLEASPLTLGSILVDKTDPTANFTLVTPSAVNKASPSITVSFTASEDLDRDPIVKIGSDLFSSTPKSNSGLDYTYEFTNLDDLSDGSKPVEVLLTDVSGNEYPSTYGSEISVDRTAPTVTPGGVAPAVANDNTDNITVFFSFSESVTGFNNNSVSVLPDEILTSYVCTNPAGDNQSFKCVFDLNTVSPADGTYEFSVVATDDAGNPMDPASVKVGEVLLDTEGIEVTFDSVTPSEVVNSTTGSVVVVLTTGEVPSETPVVKIGTELTQSTAPPATNGGKTFTYTFASLNELTDGLKNISANVEDGSGNVVTAPWSGTLEVDRTIPSIISSSVGPDYVIVITDQISLSFSFSEAMSGFSGADISVTLPGVLEAPSCSSPGGDNQTFICTINTLGLTETANGNYEFSATGSDVAGNSMSAPVLIGDVTVDRKIPSFENVIVSPLKVNSASEPVTVVFTVSETLKMDPKVILGASKVLTNSYDKTGLIYTYVFNDLLGITDGEKGFNISFEDVAGNYFDNDATGPIFDRTAPYVVAGGVAPGEVNTFTQNVNVSFTFSEPVDSFDSLDISVSPSGIFPAPSCSDNDSNRQSFTCSYDISSTVVTSETYAFSVTAKDDFGNTIDPDPDQVGTLVADTVDPTVTFNSVTPLIVNAETSSLDIIFTVDSTLEEDPSVFIGPDIHLDTPAVVVGNQYTYSVPKIGFIGIPDGGKVIRVEIRDQFGNVGVGFNPDNVVFDRTRPGITNSFVVPDPVNETSEQLTLKVNFSEPVDTYDLSITPSTLDAYFDSCQLNTDEMELDCFWTMPVLATNIDGNYEFKINATDKSGNYIQESHLEVDLLGGDSLLIDRDKPVITLDTIDVFTPGDVFKNPQIAKVGDKVITQLTFNKDLSQTPTVRLGGREMSVHGGGDCLGGICKFTSTVILADGDGAKALTVEAEDESGNVGSDGFIDVVDFDVTAPEITYESLSPEFVTEGDNIYAVFYFGEDIEVSTLQISSTIPFSKDVGQSTDSNFYYRHTVSSSSSEGEFSFKVKASDPAGNISYADVFHEIGTATIDLTDPGLTTNYCYLTVSSGYVLPSGIKAGAERHIINADCKFIADESLVDDPVLKIGGNELTSVICGGAYSHCYMYEIQGTEGDGYKVLTVEIEDIAGNEYFAYPPPNGMTETQQIAFDFTAPQLVYYMVYREPEFAGSVDGTTVCLSSFHPISKEAVNLNVQLFSDEFINPSNVSIVSDPEGFSLGASDVQDHIVRYEKEILITDSGVYSFNLTWEDMLGNRSPVAISLDWDIDIDNDGSNANDVDMDLVEFIKIPYGSDSTGGVAKYSLVGDPGAVVDSEVTMVAAYSLSGSFAGSSEVNVDGSFNISDMSSGNVDKIFINPIKRSGTSMMPEGAFDPYSDFNEVERMKYIATMGHKTAGSDLNNPNDWYETKTNSYAVEYVGTNTTFATDGDLLGLNDAIPFESGTASKWVLAGLNEHPESSYRTVMCYDSKRGRVVLFGGVENYFSNQTWEWYDGKWNLALVDDPEGDGEPEPISNGQMAYDSKRGVCVFYGGLDSGGTIMDQTWEWNGRSWERIFTSDPEGDGDPIGIYGGGLAFDSYRNVIVLAGGASEASSWHVYEYNGESWKNMPSILATSPKGIGGKMVYDKSRRVMVFAGGTHQDDETFEYAGQTFSAVCGGTTSCTGLPENDDGMMAYDANRKVVVYFGGNNGSVNTNTLREWNGTSWVTKSPSGDKPAVREEGSMVYHEGRKTVILYGGRDGSIKYHDTWEWDGTVWKRLSPMNETAWEYPLVKTDYAAAYDESRNVLILHGGMTSSSTVSNETWEWNGYSWKKLDPPTKPYRHGHTLVYDSFYHKLLMFGGMDDSIPSQYRNEVYEWSGTNWVLRTPLGGSIPNGRMYHSAIYDSVRNKMVIFGGQETGAIKVRRLHEWDNATRIWSYRINSGPEPRIHAGLVYDPVKQRSILFGGTDYSSNSTGFGDTWEYSGSANSWTKVITNPWTWGSNYPGFGCPSSEVSCWENSSGTEYPMPRWGQMMVYDPQMEKTIVSGGMVFEEWIYGYHFIVPDSWAYDSSSTSWTKLDVINANAFEEKTGIYFHKGYYNTTKNEIASWGGVKGMDSAQIAYTNTNILRTGASEVPSQMFAVGLDAVGLTEEHAWRDIESISLSVYTGATVYSGTDCAAVDGVILYGWADGRWQVLDQSPSPRSAVSELVFSINKPELIQKLLNGESSELYFKIEAKGPAGCVENNDPLLAVDYAEITVDIKEDSIKDRYYVSTVARTWDEARSECLEMDMDLAVITSKREYDIVVSLLSGAYHWIGLHEPSVDGEWKWVNGLSAWNGDKYGSGDTWTNWRVIGGSLDRPSSTNLDCGLFYVYSDNYVYYDYGCTNTARAICEKRDYTYSGITGNKISQEHACQSKGGELVSVNSEVEEEAMWPFVNGITVHHYIGLTNMSSGDNFFTWNDGEVCWDGNSGSTGTAYGYTNWSSAQPDSTSSDCVAYRPGLLYETWSDYTCDITYFGGICEF